MAWNVSCFCGHLWQGEPPDACPRCGVTLAIAHRIPTFDEWLAHTRDEIGEHTTSSDPDGW